MQLPWWSSGYIFHGMPPKKNVTGFLDSISGISSSAKSGKLFILRNFFNYLYDHHFTVRTSNDPVCHSKPSEEVKAESEKIDFSEEEVDFDTFSNWWKSLAWVRVHITDMSKE